MARKLTLLNSLMSFTNKGSGAINPVIQGGDSFGVTGFSVNPVVELHVLGKVTLPSPVHSLVALRLFDKDNLLVDEREFRQNSGLPPVPYDQGGFHLKAENTGDSANINDTHPMFQSSPPSQEVKDMRIAYKVSPDLFSAGMLEMEFLGKQGGSSTSFITFPGISGGSGGLLLLELFGAGVMTVRIPFKVEDVA
jgi:hypothetical protein